MIKHWLKAEKFTHTHIIKFLCANIIALAIGVTAQDIQLSGIVTDSTGTGIGGARVRLAVAGFSTTSDSNGRFTINEITNVVSPAPFTYFPFSKSSYNRMCACVSKHSSVKLRICSLDGKTVKTIRTGTVENPVYPLIPIYADGLYLFKSQVDSTPMSFKVLSCGTRIALSSPKSVSDISVNSQAKMSAVTDTIVASKIEYETKRVTISSYKLTNQSIILIANPPNKTNVAPGENLDLSIWSLQLPIGSGTSPTTISHSELAGANGFTDSNYFYTAVDGAMTFMDPLQGIATSGSTHCRTELREMTQVGAAAAWSSNGTNIMTVIGEVVKVGGGSTGHVTLGQVFNSSSSIPLCEFEYYTSTGGFKLLYEEAKGAGTYIDLAASCLLNTRYTFSLALTNGILTVSVNDKILYSKSISTTGAQYYFKCGAYDQTATAGTPITSPYTIVKIHALKVEHF